MKIIRRLVFQEKKQKGKGNKCRSNNERVGTKLLAINNLVHRRNP